VRAQLATAVTPDQQMQIEVGEKRPRSVIGDLPLTTQLRPRILKGLLLWSQQAWNWLCEQLAGAGEPLGAGAAATMAANAMATMDWNCILRSCFEDQEDLKFGSLEDC